ncbi:16S rRNA (uracil(1498)-N(3))-methyltransferase [Trichlorobacter ammonificans]|uniref:Ribosomal RNA small subunit methyltransferase E n=1 Tax=Trichlorobacter ammonificans TaxID=2916410 RepID=A0ABN8HH30_9BACT|nr:16S rRNA (uracil(1498)-N(3))-methyltransferase [Trichlorobacter ammonificans]CAH2030544.1 Ribosomal RNA small subunit methyltransferase E [Trichlorobacter ammonificans]
MSEQRRFMVSSRSIRDGYASYDGDLHHHMARVLRLRSGDTVLLVDELGRSHQGVIDQVTQEWTAVRLVASSAPAATTATVPAITVIQGLPRGEKVELVLQKGTELGVHDFFLFRADRSVPRLNGDKLQSRLDRWQRIVAEAARQSERFDQPSVLWHPSAAAAAAAASGADLKLLLWERGTSAPLRDKLATLPCPARIALAVGPEGGFEAEEVEAFTFWGFMPVTLGERILRTETAALAMTAILQYIWGDI